MKTFDVLRLYLVGAFMLGILIAWSASVPTTVSADESTVIFGGDSNCKCRGEIKHCSDISGGICTSNDYWECETGRVNDLCRYDTGTPCGTSSDPCKEPSPIASPFDKCS